MRILAHQINKTEKNVHLERNKEMFRKLGMEVTDIYDDDLLRGRLNQKDILYLNWFENIDGGSFYMPVLRYIRRRLQMLRIRQSGARVIFCKHNRFPHNARYPFLNRRLYTLLCSLADRIVAFNDEADADLKTIMPGRDFSDRIRVIPPLNYIGAYLPKPESETYEIARRYEGKMIVSFVGKISAYKHVELILRAAGELENEDIAFLISGEPATADYHAHLEKMAGKNSHVTMRFGKVPDDEMYPLLDVSDILMMPYDKKSASNSGTGRLAFSYGRTVISPDIASMNAIPEEWIYKYHYNTQEEHYGKMMEQLLRAYGDWRKNPEALREKGRHLKELMEREYSEKAIMKKYGQLFSELAKDKTSC